MIPMYKLYGQPVHNDLTEEQVGEAIKVGAAAVGWRAQDVRSGYMLATYNIRGHTVVVSIDYTSESYSIDYYNSVEMKVYCRGQRKRNKPPIVTTGQNTCPSGQMPTHIHGNYKDWVDGLNAGITNALNAA
jgi:hypothetical protein